MADLAEKQENAAEADLLQQALAELEAAIKPLEVDNADSNIDIAQFYYYLHLLWAEFHIYIADPFAGGEDAPSTGIAKIIPLGNGRKIFDYGFALSTSVGKDYGSYCQGKLFQTIEEMVAILAQRGVKRVNIIGNSIAMRVAWMECVARQIEVGNYEPTYYDVSVRNRILALREKAKKLKPGQELRI